MARGQLPDVTFRPDGTLAPVQETTFMGGVTWHATPLLDLYAYGGQEAQQQQDLHVGTATFRLGQPDPEPGGCLVEGGACSANLETENQINAGFWWRAYQGKFGSFRFGMQYSYTHLTAFGGAGGIKPTTDDSMVFTSMPLLPVLRPAFRMPLAAVATFRGGHFLVAAQERDFDLEAAAEFRHAAQADRAAMRLADGFDDGQPQAGADFAPVRRDAIEAVEDPLLMAGIDADAAVFDRHKAVFALDPHLRPRPRRRRAYI